MVRCRNCDGMRASGWQAVNCGLHDWYDPAADARKKQREAERCAILLGRLVCCGFTDLGYHDIHVDPESLKGGFGDFWFSHSEKLRYRQVDAIAKLFGTKSIDWTYDGHHLDSMGSWEEGHVSVRGATGPGLEEEPAEEPVSPCRSDAVESELDRLDPNR